MFKYRHKKKIMNKISNKILLYKFHKNIYKSNNNR